MLLRLFAQSYEPWRASGLSSRFLGADKPFIPCGSSLIVKPDKKPLESEQLGRRHVHIDSHLQDFEYQLWVEHKKTLKTRAVIDSIASDGLGRCSSSGS